MNYKISETPLKLREYGRNIQAMVEHARTLEDDEMRNALVHEIIRIMQNINPSVKDLPDYEIKLWDSLYHLADYNIKVDSEFPMPAPESFRARPEERMEYSNRRPRFRQYGSNVDLMIKEAVAMEDGDMKDQLVNMIANIMKMHLKSDERDGGVEVTVVEHLKSMSGGKIAPTVDEINFYKGPPKNQTPQRQNNNHHKKRKKNKRRY